MESNVFESSLEQEMMAKADELLSQRSMREGQMVDIVLGMISDGVVSKEKEIDSLLEASKGQCQNKLRETMVKEIIRSANGLLWCPEYSEKAHSDQLVKVYTGSHWESVEPQQWKDFVGTCAEKCGIPESMCMTPSFMKPLYESAAFNFAKNRKQLIPDGEVRLNVLNGTLVIKKDGEVMLHDHCKEDLFTYTLNYAYDHRAVCPLWDVFVNRVLPEKESQMVLAEFIGYCLMPNHSLEKMLMLYGGGQNGKSVTLEIIEALLGSCNVSYLSLSDLTNDDVKRASIEHKLLNVSHESGKDVNPNVLKQLTSGERVLIKHLYADPRDTNDYGKFIAAFNELPRAENTFGFFRRLIILPYEVTITKEEIDRQLATKLRAELPGILNWVLKALPPLMTRGEFTVSEKCEKALERYRLQSDNVRLFVNEICEPSEFTIKSTDVYEAYAKYCFASSLKPKGRNTFYDRMESLGYTRTEYAHVKFFYIKLKEV